MGKSSTVKKIVKDKGLSGLLIAALEKAIFKIKKMQGQLNQHQKLDLLADVDNIVKVDWKNKRYRERDNYGSGPYKINWVIHPGGETSGGSQNIIRFVKFLEEAGHQCTVYFYAVRDFTLEEVARNFAKNYDKVKAEFKYLDGPMDEADAIFATGWETAYPVFNDPSDAKRFYFVQDFEPYFYPKGSSYALAENTYKFGFHGITAGKWLAQHLSKEYKMECDSFDFGVDTDHYRLINDEPRNKIMFYARPVTPRRAFELGVITLSRFHELCPDVEIIMAGWDVSNYEIHYPYTNLAMLSIAELPDVYNQCSAALVLSTTNLSLLPAELLSCGVIPVVNEGENNRLVVDNEYIEYSEAYPEALAQKLAEVVNRQDQVEYAIAASSSVQDRSWSISAKQFCDAFEKRMNG